MTGRQQFTSGAIFGILGVVAYFAFDLDMVSMQIGGAIGICQDLYNRKFVRQVPINP